jgi:glycosyltransferase involved in cell wall biosynthesis
MGNPFPSIRKFNMILFVSHDAHRAGAQLLLLNLLKWFKENTKSRFAVLLKNGGELFDQFSSIAPTDVWNLHHPKKSLFGGVNQFLLRKHQRKLIKKYQHSGVGLIYSNTITNGHLLDQLSVLSCPVITHVHELDYWIAQLGNDNLEKVKKHTDHYIAVSKAVFANLTDKHQVPSDRVSVVYAFINHKNIVVSEEDRSYLTQGLNIPAESMIVGASGTENWRKGKDLFIPIAVQVLKNFSEIPVHFVWVGGEPTYELSHDLEKSGLKGNVHFIRTVQNPYVFYNQIDVFVMLSREDPFPLVNLELGFLGKPIVCFANAGGTAEFVGEDAGFVVPYLDLQDMAERVTLLLKDRNLRMQMGVCARQKAAERYDVSIAGMEILRKIEDLMR